MNDPISPESRRAHLGPTDEQLAELFPWTLHTRWLRGGFQGHGAQPDAPPCACEFCRKLRRDRFKREH